MGEKIDQILERLYKKEIDLLEVRKELLILFNVSSSFIKVPKPSLKFEGIDNISIIGEKDIPLSELFELYLKLEDYLKSRPEVILNNKGIIVGFKN